MQQKLNFLHYKYLDFVNVYSLFDNFWFENNCKSNDSFSENNKNERYFFAAILLRRNIFVFTLTCWLIKNGFVRIA